MSDRLVIFDLDGVLVDSREVHFIALNEALVEHGYKPVPRDVHLSTFDGLPTSKKLDLLNIPKEKREKIWDSKQDITEKLLCYPQDHGLISIFRKLSAAGIHIAIASNAIRETVEVILKQIGVRPYVEFIASNQDVDLPKPSPKIYWYCMEHFQVSARDTVIVEDSQIGRKAALASGANLFAVESRKDVSYEKIMKSFPEEIIHVKWRDKKLNVLIPMAGEGSRFTHAGYTFPKPLIDIQGKPMIQHVVENLNIEATYSYIVKQEHYDKYKLEYLLNLLTPNCHIFKKEIDVRQGAAYDALLATEQINTDDPLLIANSDQIIEWDSSAVMYGFSSSEIDGGIVTFNSLHPKWSYVRLDPTGFVAEVAEKKVISSMATVGIYYWQRGKDFIKYVKQMMEADDRTNGEFYIAPVFNYAIREGKKIRAIGIQKMHGLGDPESLQEYLRCTT